MNAILNIGRLNAFRLNYQPAALKRLRDTTVIVWIGGGVATGRVRKQRLSVRDQLNDAPNTCALVVEGTEPTPGQDVRVSVNSNVPHLLFDGTVQTVDGMYEARPQYRAWSVQATDDMSKANHRRPFGNWVDTSATTIAQQLVAQFAPGMTATHVQAGLPSASVTFDGTETFGGGLKRLATLIGGYCYVEDNDVHLFLTEATDVPDAIDTTPGRLLDAPPITKTIDDSQLHTRVYGKGHGESALVDVAVGATIIPIADAVMFNPLGGKAIAGSTPDGAQYQRLNYTGTQIGLTGTVVGPGVQPSAAPTLGGAAGAGIENGIHQYAYTWVTASGETAPSPLASYQHGTVAGGTTAPVFLFENDGVGIGLPPAYNPGDVVRYAYTYGLRGDVLDYTATGLHTAASPVLAHTAIAQTGNPTWPRPISMSVPMSADPRAAIVYLWRSVNGGTYRGVRATTNVPAYGSWPISDEATTITNGAGIPAAAATVNQTTIAAIAVGPSGTTSRKVYRTVAGGAQLKLQQTVAGNAVTVGANDATPDASLGANAPVADTSGLVTAPGQVNPGATSVLTASAAPFSAAGGYVFMAGGQVVRYTGITGNTLTGVPASGPGAIVTVAPYGSPVTAAPTIGGVTGVTQPILKGAKVCIWVQRDNAAAQSARAAIDAAQGRITDGVVEHVLTDDRRGEPSLIAQCDADLRLFAYPIVTVTYDSRDLKTRSGKPIAFNLPSQGIVATLTIQDVTITEIDIAPGTSPRFHVSASSTRYSLEDILRQLLTETNAT